MGVGRISNVVTDCAEPASLHAMLRCASLSQLEGSLPRRIGLLIDPTDCRMNARQSKTWDRDVFPVLDSGERNGLAVRIGRRAPVLCTGRIVIGRVCVLSFGKAEEAPHVGRADRADIVYL